MAININHSKDTIRSTNDGDLVLDNAGIGDITVSSHRVKDVLDPVEAQDAVTKSYLDNSLANINLDSIINVSGGLNVDGSVTGSGDFDLNEILNSIAKLKPQSPPTIDSKTLQISGSQSYRITSFSQTDNTGQGLSATPGEIISNVLRSDDFSTNTISQVGPGDSGTISVIRNSLTTSSVDFTESVDNGSTTDTDTLTISNNVDYGTITGDTTGFYQVYDVRARGTNVVPEGWNDIKLSHDDSETNTVTWYSDQSNPGSPVVTNIQIEPNTTQHIVYSSTVPHYTSSQVFDISFDVANLSGDFYPATDKFFDAAPSVSSSSGLAVLSDLEYDDVGIVTPLPRNYLTDGSTYTVTTSTNVRSGTGIGSATTGPSATLTNSYSTATVEFEPGRKILYMLDDQSGIIDETNIPVENVGFGSGYARRLETADGDNPVSPPSFTNFNSETSTLNDWDGVVAGGDLTHDTTDYSTGYYPAGPNLDTPGRDNSQYFEVAFNRVAVSKFAIEWSGKISGCWVKLPGTQIDNTSTLNGWLDTTVPYEGSGVPGANTAAGGNGTNGCGLGSILSTGAVVNTQVVNITFGTESSSNADDNLIILRFKLDAEDSITHLKFRTAT